MGRSPDSRGRQPEIDSYAVADNVLCLQIMSVARPIIVNASDFHRPFLKVIPAISPEITRTTVVARARLTRLGRNDDCRNQRTGLTKFLPVQDIEHATNMDTKVFVTCVYPKQRRNFPIGSEFSPASLVSKVLNKCFWNFGIHALDGIGHSGLLTSLGNAIVSRCMRAHSVNARIPVSNVLAHRRFPVGQHVAA